MLNKALLGGLGPLSLDSAITTFLNYSRSNALSDKTITYYRERLRSFHRYVGDRQPGMTLGDVTVEFVRDFLSFTREHSSSATANHNRAVLFRMFGFLVSEGLLALNPVGGVPKLREPKKLIQTFTPEEVAALLKTCDTASFVGARDLAMVVLLYDCGLRISELLELRLDDMRWDRQTLIINGKGDKERSVPFGVTSRRALTSYLIRRGELEGQQLVFVNQFGERMDRNAVRWTLKRRAKRAGITGPRVSPHTLRHSFAVSFIRNGGDVFSLQRLLGHSSLSMTKRYVELADSDVAEAHRRFSPADRLEMSAKHGRKRIPRVLGVERR